MSPFHVSGGCLTRSLRYQSSWVFELAGAAQSLPWYSAVFSGPESVPCLTFEAYWSGQDRIHPALANSAVHTTSIDMRSIDGSLAARRRTSCWRWVSASLPSRLTLMCHLPPDCFEHWAAALPNEPLGSS